MQARCLTRELFAYIDESVPGEKQALRCSRIRRYIQFIPRSSNRNGAEKRSSRDVPTYYRESSRFNFNFYKDLSIHLYCAGCTPSGVCAI